MKEIRFKKGLALLLTTALCLVSLCACGGNNDNAASGNSGGQTEGNAGGQTEGNAGGSSNDSGEYTEITFWNSMDTSYGEILQSQIDEFNNTIGEEKKIKVTSVFQSYPGTEAFSAAMTSDDIENMPDVIQLYSESVSLVRNYDRLVWAEDMITGEGSTLSKDDIIPNVLESYSIDGKLIGVPYNIACYLLYYNKTQLEQAGYSEPPKTIAEMTEMLPNLVENTDADYGLNVRINMNELLNFVETQGAEGSLFGDNNNGHTGLMTKLQCVEDGTLKQFIDAWGDVINTGAYKPVRDSINEEFAAGMYSMVIMSSSRLKTIEELVGDGFEWGVAPMPTVNENDAAGSFPTGSGLFIVNRDMPEKVEAAWEFVQYMASPEIQAVWLDTTGYVPVNKNVLESDTYQSIIEADARMSVPYDTLINSPSIITSPYVPNYSAVDTLIQDTMVSFGNQEMDADAAYSAIADGVQEIFDEYYRINPAE